jgi:hypothetical protein
VNSRDDGNPQVLSLVSAPTVIRFYAGPAKYYSVSTVTSEHSKVSCVYLTERLLDLW